MHFADTLLRVFFFKKIILYLSHFLVQRLENMKWVIIFCVTATHSWCSIDLLAGFAFAALMVSNN